MEILDLLFFFYYIINILYIIHKKLFYNTNIKRYKMMQETPAHMKNFVTVLFLVPNLVVHMLLLGLLNYIQWV